MAAMGSGIKAGDRVGAIRNTDPKAAYLFGFGVFEGHTVPDRGVLGELGLPNPTILLDSGERVYGFECWWGPEDKVRDMIGGRPIEIVPAPTKQDYASDRPLEGGAS